MINRIISRRFGIALMYALLSIYMVNLLIEASNFGDPRARTFPVAFGIPTVGLLVIITMIQIAPSIISKDKINKSRISKDFYDFNDEDRGELNFSIIAVFISFPFVAYLFGFFIAVPLYTGLFTAVTTKSLKRSIIVAIAVSIGWYILFISVLNVIFYQGVITNMIM